MTVSSLTVDPFTSTPIVVLKENDGKQSLAIWIGLVEASAIATELDKIELDRPMTHDLATEMLRRLGAQVVRVEILDLRDNTFFATLVVKDAGGAELALDARPSDAIALALRAGAPIHVAQKVIDRARKIDLRLAPPAPNLRAGAVPVETLPDVAEALADGGDDADDLETDPAARAAPRAVGRDPEAAALLESLSAVAFGKWKM